MCSDSAVFEEGTARLPRRALSDAEVVSFYFSVPWQTSHPLATAKVPMGFLNRANTFSLTHPEARSRFSRAKVVRNRKMQQEVEQLSMRRANLAKS